MHEQEMSTEAVHIGHYRNRGPGCVVPCRFHSLHNIPTMRLPYTQIRVSLIVDFEAPGTCKSIGSIGLKVLHAQLSARV
jgi:hypothetical protein